ncbi:MAG: patatin-like phospholipase family protein [Paracoccaceae bacterium]
MRIFALVLGPLLVVTACTGVRPLEPPPDGPHLMAEIPGFPGVRYWGDETPPGLEQSFDTLLDQFRTRVAREGALPNGGRLDTLVLSGGGSDGPFGAGLLVGWTEKGDRPEFGIVTGISAGALIAPFAFLGPDYDQALRDFTLENSTETLLELTIASALLDGLGVFDTTPLRSRLSDLLTPEAVAAIGAEYDRGRRLWIGTTNLDAQRPVYWNITRIASIGGPDARDLIIKIMLASSAIPGAFPPQYFAVEIDGERYSEMHVDGGVTNQLFFYPETVDLRQFESLDGQFQNFARRGTIYVIRNTKLEPDFSAIAPSILNISARSLSTMIKFGGRNDIQVLEQIAARDGFGVKVTSVPETFDMEENELFDPVYMQALFQVGYDLAAGEGTWRVEIPGG